MLEDSFIIQANDEAQTETQPVVTPAPEQETALDSFIQQEGTGEPVEERGLFGRAIDAVYDEEAFKSNIQGLFGETEPEPEYVERSEAEKMAFGGLKYAEVMADELAEKTIVGDLLHKMGTVGSREQERIDGSFTLADTLGISYEEAYEKYPHYSKLLGNESLMSPSDTFHLGLSVATATGIVKAPMTALMGLPVFAGIGEMANISQSIIANKEYQPFQASGFKTLAPKNANEFTKIGFEIVDLAWQLYATNKICKSKAFSKYVVKTVLPKNLQLKFYAERMDIDNWIETKTGHTRQKWEKWFKEKSEAMDAEWTDVPTASGKPANTKNILQFDGTKEPIPKEVRELMSVVPKPYRQPSLPEGKVPSKTPQVQTAKVVDKPPSGAGRSFGEPEAPIFRAGRPAVQEEAPAPKPKEKGVTREEKYEKIDAEIQKAKENQEVAKQESLEATKELQVLQEKLEPFKRSIVRTAEDAELSEGIPAKYITANAEKGRPIEVVAKEHGFNSPAELKAHLIGEEEAIANHKAWATEAKKNAKAEKVTRPLIQDLERRISDYKQGGLEGIKDMKEVNKELASHLKALKGWEAIGTKVRQTIKSITPKNYEKKLEELRDVYLSVAESQTKLRLAKNINRDIPKNVHIQERTAINRLREAIDTKFYPEKGKRLSAKGEEPVRRRRSKKEQREQSLEYFKQHRDEFVDLPEKVITDILKTPLEDATTLDLIRLDETINGIVEKGKLRRRVEVAQDKARIDEMRNILVDAIMGGKAIQRVSPPNPQRRLDQGKLKTLAKQAKDLYPTWDKLILKQYTVADMIDGRPEAYQGPVHDMFLNKINEGYNKELEMKDARKKWVKDEWDKIGLTIRELDAPITVDEYTFTRSQAMGIYALSKNRKMSEAMELRGNNIPKDLQKKVSDALPEKYKKGADIIVQDFAKYKKPLFDVKMRLDNELPYSEWSYIPAVQKNSELMFTEEAIQLEADFNAPPTISKGMTIDRTEPSRLPQGILENGLEIDLYKLWHTQMPKHAHYISQAENIRDLNKVLNHRDVRLAIEQNERGITKDHIEILSSGLSAVARPFHWRPDKGLNDGFNRFLDWMRIREGASFLIGNVPSVMRQSFSMYHAIHRTNPINFAKSMEELHRSPWHFAEIYKFARENDPQLRHRTLYLEDAEISFFAEGNPSVALANTFQKYGLLPQRMVDAYTCTVVWYSVYNYQTRWLNKGHKEAVREAQNAVLQTQPQGASKDTVPLQRSSVGALASRFNNQAIQEYQMLRHEIPKATRHDPIKALMFAIGMSTVAMLNWTLRNKQLPSDEDDIFDGFREQAEFMIPVIGPAMTQRRKGYGSGIDLFSTYSRVGNAIKPDMDAEEIGGAVSNLGLILLGAPTIGTKRAYEAIEEGELDLILGADKETGGGGAGTKYF